MGARVDRIAAVVCAVVGACGDDGVPSGSGSTGATTMIATSSSTATPTTSSPNEDIGATTDTPEPEDCVADPPPEAMLRMGLNDDGTFLVAGGRRLTPAGKGLVVPGFPADIEVHPLADVAYVTSRSRYERKLLVVDLEFDEAIAALRAWQTTGVSTPPDDDE